MKACSSNHNAANRFTLRGGERIKVGRIIFTVKEIVNATTRYIEAPTVQEEVSSSSETPGLLSQTDDGQAGSFSLIQSPKERRAKSECPSDHSVI
jgi:hypothetical protein